MADRQRSSRQGESVTMTTTEFHQLKTIDLADLAQSRCGDCGGTGKTLIEERERRFLPDQTYWTCSCRQEFLRRIEDAEFPSQFSEATLSDLEWSAVQPDDVRASLQTYADHSNDYLAEHFGALLLGPVGCGKTHLAVGLAKIAVALGYTALFVNVPEWLQSLLDSYGQGSSETERTWMDNLRNVDVLVLDDLGAEKPSDWMRERLYLVVNHRTVTRRVNIVTSNQSLDELETGVGERIMDRLYADALVFALRGASFRRRQRDVRLARIAQAVHAR